MLGGVAVATAAVLRGAVGSDLLVPGPDPAVVRLEHPTGYLDVRISVTGDPASGDVRSAVVRTARKLFDGEVVG